MGRHQTKGLITILGSYILRVFLVLSNRVVQYTLKARLPPCKHIICRGSYTSTEFPLPVALSQNLCWHRHVTLSGPQSSFQPRPFQKSDWLLLDHYKTVVALLISIHQSIQYTSGSQPFSYWDISLIWLRTLLPHLVIWEEWSWTPNWEPLPYITSIQGSIMVKHQYL